MASIIPGYEYDIFISYRQKDNKGDKWVSEFVAALKDELESTFKEEISVYFDINPHDGLLETHDVDASLKEKLKCLVFIPIISRTYCDPKSFAWEHEFKAFIGQASNDQFGLKVKVAGGNVANRVLPVQIHDLNADDKKLVEEELGGYLRGIEFIYKEPGVNRPLTPDDDEKKNLNGAKYKNQINKVANSINEIIDGLKNSYRPGKAISDNYTEEKPSRKKDHRKKIIIGALIVLALILAGYFIIPKLSEPQEKLEKSVAVLPFKLLSDDPDEMYLADGMMEAITLHLSKIKDLHVMPRTSVEQYRGTIKTSRQIGKELDVDFLLEGSFQKFGNDAKLIVQLIKVRTESNAWGNEYKSKWSEIFSLQSEVAQSVAMELRAVITPIEKQLIEKEPTNNLIAFDFYLRGNKEQSKYSFEDSSTVLDLYRAEEMYKKALEYDSLYAQAYLGMAQVFWDKHYWETFISENFLDSVLILANKALEIDDQLAEAYRLKGAYFRQISEYEQAIKELSKAIEFNPNDGEAYYRRAEILFFNTNDYVRSFEDFQIAMSLVSESQLPDLYRDLSWEYLLLGFIEKANYYCEKAFILDKDSSLYYFYLSAFEFGQGNYVKSLELNHKSYAIDSSESGICFRLGEAYLFLGQDKEALKYFKDWQQYPKSLSGTDIYKSYYIGWAYWQNGFKKDAEVYFDKQIEFSTRIKEKGRSFQTEKPSYDLAAVYTIMGDRKKAYENLRELDRMPFCQLWDLTWLKNAPFFNSIRSEPEFLKIVQDQEAKYFAQHERAKKWLKEHGFL